MIRLTTNTFPHQVGSVSRSYLPLDNNDTHCLVVRTDTSPLETAPLFEMQRCEVVHEHT